jgi:hypothetical protein
MKQTNRRVCPPAWNRSGPGRASILTLRAWALALALAWGGPAAAQEPDILSVLGQPVLALAQRPELTTGLRFNSGGHRSALAARLRDPGPPVTLVDGDFLQGWACRPEGCRVGGVFLAFDRRDDRIYLMLTENGAVRLSVPPDPRGWPEALRDGVGSFVPALAAVIGTRP